MCVCVCVCVCVCRDITYDGITLDVEYCLDMEIAQCDWF